MNGFERGDRVDVADHGGGTVTGWQKQVYGGWFVEVDLDTGGQWIGHHGWLEQA